MMVGAKPRVAKGIGIESQDVQKDRSSISTSTFYRWGTQDPRRLKPLLEVIWLVTKMGPEARSADLGQDKTELNRTGLLSRGWIFLQLAAALGSFRNLPLSVYSILFCWREWLMGS